MWLLGFGLIILALFVMAILGSIFNWDNSVLSFFVSKIWLPLLLAYGFIYWIKTDIIDRKKEKKKVNEEQSIIVEHNEITKKIINIISEQLKENLSSVKQEEYEENGKVYYMNGQNGTFFDWTVNGRLPYFMVFYKDGSCGAIKVHIKTNGEVETYLYKYGENKPFITKTNAFKFNKRAVLELAVILTKVADEKNIFDKSLNDMNTNIVVTDNDINEFLKEEDDTLSKKNEEIQNDDDFAPGWDAITSEFERIYPGQINPKHYGVLLGYELGGNDPLQGISVYDAGDSWHFVSYGLTELYNKTSSNAEISGYGMEFTFRLKKGCYDDEESEIKCICGILQQLARTTFQKGELFLPYEYMYTGQTAGIDVKQKSKLTGFISIPDTRAKEIETPNGKVMFVEFIGVTDDELRAILNKEIRVKELYEKLGTDITDYNRDSVIASTNEIKRVKDENTINLEPKFENNLKGIEYLKKLKETYIKRGHKKEWEHLENIVNGISESDKERLLKEYPEIPESLLEILNNIDGTYHRLYGNEKITFYFFSSDVEEGKYPYYLLSSTQMLNDSVEFLDCYIKREFDDVPVSEEITNDINNVKLLHFADCMNNGGTSKLYIDFSPSDKGKKGQIIRFLHDQDSLEVIAESFDEFLDMIIKNEFKFIEDV